MARQMMLNEIKFRCVGICLMLGLSACSAQMGSRFSGSQDPAALAQPRPTPTPSPVADPRPPATEVPPVSPVDPQIPPAVKMEPLLWEKANEANRAWSSYVFRLLQGVAHSMVEKVKDMEIFCPSYPKLSEDQKVNAVGMFISAIAKFESDFNPLVRYRESTMGQDPITGLPVYSEGLLQLSYQDETNWSFCKFDWAQDKKLDATDPKKSILDPYKNLDCGVRILSEQVDRTGRLVIDQGAYWAVIKDEGKYQKINEIAKLVKTLKFCN